MEVRYLIQVTESLIFTNLEIGIFCTVQEPSWYFLISYESKNIFIYSLLYDPFYCDTICFTAVFKIITAVTTCSYRLPIFGLCFCLEPREGKHVSVRPNSALPPQMQTAFSWFVHFVLFKYNGKTQKQCSAILIFCSSTCMDTPIIDFFTVNSILSQSWPDLSAKRFMSTVCLILDHVSVSCRIACPDPCPSAKFP